MKQHGFISLIMLLAAILACGPTQSLVQTAVPKTPTGEPTSRPRATFNLAAPTDTELAASADTPTDVPSNTPQPSHTPRPARTATPRVPASPSPAASATRTAKPTRAATAAPSFLTTVVAVKKQVENFGGQIDIAVGSGTLDCQQTVDSYNYVAARATLKNVPDSLAGAYSLYTQGVSLFLSKSADLYTNCNNFLADPNASGSVPALQWTVARTAVNDAGDLLRQAIIAAGGTP